MQSRRLTVAGPIKGKTVLSGSQRGLLRQSSYMAVPNRAESLHKSAGGIPLSARTWSGHLLRGQPGRSLHS